MLPDGFYLRMKTLLGDEIDDFVSSLSEPAVRGIRLNSIKNASKEELIEDGFSLTEIPYWKGAFISDGDDKIGKSPAHHSGQIYVQDPGAMSALSALEIKEGWRVLDLCSAPGGKSGQAAERIGESGFLLSNEFVPKRAKICVGNFERLGYKNAMVTSLDTKEFKKYFNAHFDLVIVDAPCSGEGMFRKNENATLEWSEENVAISAERQREILDNAAPLVKPCGYLVYSTCTFSLEENEMQVDAFLERHSDFTIEKCQSALIEASSDGINFEGASNANLHYARRFYPHKSRGEGQFVALLKKKEGESAGKTVLYKDASCEASREEMNLVKKFFSENLSSIPAGNVRKIGENLVLISHGCPVLPKSVFSAGVLIGEVRRGVLHPAHQFFSCYGTLFKRKLSLTKDDERLKKYLMGEEIPAPEIDSNGYVAVLYKSTALGGGKFSSGVIKNHYPKGLRNVN